MADTERVRYRFYKLVMEDGSELIIRSASGMLDLGNDLRAKAKIEVETPQGEKKTIKSDNVHSIENYILPRG